MTKADIQSIIVFVYIPPDMCDSVLVYLYFHISTYLHVNKVDLLEEEKFHKSYDSADYNHLIISYVLYHIKDNFVISQQFLSTILNNNNNFVFSFQQKLKKVARL